MKKLLLVITVLAMLLLVSCNEKENNGGEQNGEGTSQGSYDPTKPLIWEPTTDVYLVSDIQGSERQTISDNFTDLTGNYLMPHSADKDKKAHEVVIGPSTRPISQAAYHLLDRNMTEDEDAEGYVVLVQDGSVAIAYSSDAAYREAMRAFYENCCVSHYHADNGPVYWDFYSLSARAEENREKMYAEGFAKLEQELVQAGAENASAIIKELKTYYNLFKTEQLYWLSDLYDPETGAFYYSNSGRDNIGYLPDIESTGQAFMMLDRGGLFSVVGGYENNTGNSLPAFIAEPLTKWLRDLQDPVSGFFYHPQWGSSIATSRRGRDLDNVVSLFKKYLNALPYYNDPSNRLKGTLGAPGENAVKPASALASRLGTSAIKAVSAITPVASSRPPYLQSLEAWKDYVDNLNINGDGQSYSKGNTLVSDWALIKEAGKEYEEYVINYLNRTMIPEIGLWEYQNEQDYDPNDQVGYNGTNGLMKLCVLYNSLGYAVPNAYNALLSTIKVGLYPNTDPKDETVCYVLNIWTCLSSMMKCIKEDDPDNFPAAQKLLAENMEGLLKASYDLQHTHLMEDGGFSYFERREMNISQSAPVGCSRGPESDINATMVATISTIGNMYGAIHRTFGTTTSVPIWGPDDYYLFMNELEKAGEVYKKEIPQAEVIDFNDYVEADIVEGTEKQPDDDIYLSINTNFFNSNVVQRPGTVVADADLALRMESMVETEYDPDSSMDMPLRDEKGNQIMAPAPSNAYIAIGNALGNGNCYSFEAEILFEEADIGQILQIFFMNSKLGSNFYLAGLQFNTYKNGDDKYIRLIDLYQGLDQAQDQNIYEKLKVGDWFKIKLEVYKVYIENDDETQTLELYIKIYINDKYITTSDSAFTVGTKVNDIEPDKVMLSQYRYRGSTIYIDNILTERTDLEYEKEIVRNEVTFDDGTILCSPSISVNVGSATGTLVNDTVEEGDTEGGNDRNYFKIRDDLEGKVGDAVLEVYHKADKKGSGYGASNINIGITDGSTSGYIFVLEFDMMLNVIDTYNDSSNFFTRIRISSPSNAGLYHDLTSNGTDVICRRNGSGNFKLGNVGEWFHVKMIWYAINPSNANINNPNAHTVEFYLITEDAEGNETLADYTSLYTSYIATNKSLSNVYFTGSENGSNFDQQYFLDNITYIRTNDKSILPAKPAE